MNHDHWKKWIWLFACILLLRALGSALIQGATVPADETVPTKMDTTAQTGLPAMTPVITPTTGVPAGPSVSVKSFGAAGDGIANDTAAIQRALDTRAAFVQIPDGTYMIDATVSLKPRSNQTIQLSANAVLKAIPNAAAIYNIVRIATVANVEISGGQIVGDRDGHLGGAGEYGMGIFIGNSASNVRIRDIAIMDCWGDAIYIGGTAASNARNILIENVTCNNNRRQGLSITNGEQVTVRNSVFINTRGTNPQSGLDIEPNTGGHVSHVVIENCQFLNNAGYGLVISPHASLYVDDVVVRGCTFAGNRARGFAVTNYPQARNIRLEIRAGQTEILPYEFSGCPGLDQVSIPNSVTAIGNGAFMNAGDLESIVIPEKVATIGADAFRRCFRLTSVYFQGNAPVLGTNTFAQTAPGFMIRFLDSRTGFTAPSWQGYPASAFVP